MDLYKDFELRTKNQSVVNLNHTEESEVEIDEKIQEEINNYHQNAQAYLESLKGNNTQVINNVVQLHNCILYKFSDFDTLIFAQNSILEAIMACSCDKELYYTFFIKYISINKENALETLKIGLIPFIIQSGELFNSPLYILQLIHEYCKYSSEVFMAVIFSSNIIFEIISNFKQIPDDNKGIYARIIATILTNSSIKPLLELNFKNKFSDEEASDFLILENKPFNEDLFHYYQQHGIPVNSYDQSPICDFFIEYIYQHESLFALQHIIFKEAIECKYILFNPSFKEIFFDLDKLLSFPKEFHIDLVSVLDRIFYRMEIIPEQEYFTNIMRYLLSFIISNESDKKLFEKASNAIVNFLAATNYPQFIDDLFDESVIATICNLFNDSEFHKKKAAMFLFLIVASNYKLDIINEDSMEIIIDFIDSDLNDTESLEFIVINLTSIFEANEEYISLFQDLGGSEVIERLIEDKKVGERMSQFYNDYFDDTEIVLNLDED